MWPHDPEYVKEMTTPDFDPHLDLAVFAKALTSEQAQAHKDGTQKFVAIRKIYKGVNYASMGHVKLRELRGPLEQAILSQAY